MDECWVNAAMNDSAPHARVGQPLTTAAGELFICQGSTSTNAVWSIKTDEKYGVGRFSIQGV